MTKIKKSKELPSLTEEIKHNYDEMRKGINKIKFKIEVHLNHQVSKDIISSLDLFIDTFSRNIRAAEESLNEIKNKDKSEYTFHDLDKLHMVLSLLTRIEIPLSKLNLQIYEYLDSRI